MHHQFTDARTSSNVTTTDTAIFNVPAIRRQNSVLQKNSMILVVGNRKSTDKLFFQTFEPDLDFAIETLATHDFFLCTSETGEVVQITNKKTEAVIRLHNSEPADVPASHSFAVLVSLLFQNVKERSIQFGAQMSMVQ